MKRAAVPVIAAVASGCMGLPPVLPPMPGCYSVQASNWSADFAAATGIRQLPAEIGIDTDRERAVLVPTSWRRQISDSALVLWTEEPPAWEGPGDLVTLSKKKHRRMPGDSMRVSFGLDAFATAVVGPTPTGFAGPMQLGARPGYSVAHSQLALTRRDCAGLDLVRTGRP